MGCNVNCPAIPCEYREDWGLSDPTGKNDVEFSKGIHSIHTKILELTEKIKKDELISKKIRKNNMVIHRFKHILFLRARWVFNESLHLP